MDAERLRVRNTVTERVDVKHLEASFRKGNAAETGLPLANRAARANGFQLSLSCTVKEFAAELKF